MNSDPEFLVMKKCPLMTTDTQICGCKCTVQLSEQ